MLPFFLELFAGCAALSRSMARCGIMSLAIDIRFGRGHDLTSPKLLAAIRGWIAAGWILGLHLAPPCNSWSRARCMPGGPPMLRTAGAVLGLLGLAAHDLEKVRLGNATMRATVSIAAACIAQRVPFCVENPATSFLWLAPSMQWLARRQGVQLSRTDFCAFGTPWRKRTSLLHFGLDASQFVRVCHRRGGLCEFSHKPHQILSGQCSTGTFWTKVAEAYPTGFASSLASAFRRADQHRCGEHFWKIAQ